MKGVLIRRKNKEAQIAGCHQGGNAWHRHDLTPAYVKCLVEIRIPTRVGWGAEWEWPKNDCSGSPNEVPQLPLPEWPIFSFCLSLPLSLSPYHPPLADPAAPNSSQRSIYIFRNLIKKDWSYQGGFLCPSKYLVFGFGGEEVLGWGGGSGAQT